MRPILLLCVLTFIADDSPFTPPSAYTAKITFPLGTLVIKGEKYKLQFTMGPKGGILDDGESLITWNDSRKTTTREASGLVALRKKWGEAGKEEKEKIRTKLAGWAFNPFLREWIEVDGKKYTKSDGGVIAGKETELIETKGAKFWRIKGTYVVVKSEMPGITYEAKKIEEGIEVADDLFKPPQGYAEKKSESEITDVQSAEAIWKKLTG